MKLGAHVSNQGEKMLLGAVEEAISYGANAFMIYLGAPQNTFRKELSQFRIDEAHELMALNGMLPSDCIVHAPYIVNLAQPNEEKRQFAVDFIVSEVKKTAAIGATIIVIHPGAALDQGLDQGIETIIQSLRDILTRTQETDVILALETMAGKGSEVCFDFHHLQTIIKALDSPRIGVCLDTCHISDAGYPLRNDREQVLNEFDAIVGFSKLAVIHVNDSKNPCGAKKDRHENLGFGCIGFESLVEIVWDERFCNIPKILETPYVKEGEMEYPPYRFEIAMLRSRSFNPELLELIKKQ
ncbi:MAG: deoxyribonuclease IV [Bacilli bacterium]|nr:deoxyribonuclease IV [Bacilli bacterium]